MVVLPALVAGHLATLGVGNRKVEVPALAQFGGDGARQQGVLAAQQVGHGGREGGRFLAVEIDAERAARIGRPDADDRAGALHVGHDIFLAAVAVFDPQVIAAIAVGEPRLRVGRRGRRPIVGGELLGDVGRIGELGHRRQIRHVVQQARHGNLCRHRSAGKAQDKDQNHEADGRPQADEIAA